MCRPVTPFLAEYTTGVTGSRLRKTMPMEMLKIGLRPSNDRRMNREDCNHKNCNNWVDKRNEITSVASSFVNFMGFCRMITLFI